MCRCILVIRGKGERIDFFVGGCLITWILGKHLLSCQQWRVWHNLKICVKGFTIHGTPLSELMLRELWNAFLWTLTTFHNVSTFWTIHWLLMHWCWLVRAYWSKWQSRASLCSFVLIFVIFLFACGYLCICISCGGNF